MIIIKNLNKHLNKPKKHINTTILRLIQSVEHKETIVFQTKPLLGKALSSKPHYKLKWPLQKLVFYNKIFLFLYLCIVTQPRFQ